jgi:hypothetical protein
MGMGAIMGLGGDRGGSRRSRRTNYLWHKRINRQNIVYPFSKLTLHLAVMTSRPRNRNSDELSTMFTTDEHPQPTTYTP